MVRARSCWWPWLVLSALAAAQGTPELAAFVQTHCVECHGGDATKGGLDLLQPPVDAAAALWRWSRLRQRVAAGEMPPRSAEAPPPEERRRFEHGVAELLRVEVPKLPPDPGRVTVRRLSRTQWENCVRDLFGVAVATSSFPNDDLAYGFDTIGEALSFSTLHLEHHLAAAGAVAAQVFHGEDPARPEMRRFEAEAMPVVEGPGADQDGEIAVLYTRAALAQEVELPRDGVYRLRVLAGADQAGDEAARLVVRRDGVDLVEFEVERLQPRAFELRTPLPGGRQTFALAFVNDFYAPDHPDPARRDRNLRLDRLELEGPLDARPVPPAQRWLATAVPAGADDAGALRATVRALLPRVWRRPVGDDELARSIGAGLAVLRAGQPLYAAQRLVLQAALASPHFLFRVEPAAAGAGVGGSPLPSIAIASRLSFFLWSSTPDEALLDQARRGRLDEPAVLAAEIDRLLADPRAEALATDFAAQWLELRSLAERTPDPARFPGFDDALRRSLRRETELLFLAVLREGRDVRDLVDCDFTHVDALLAAHYGLPRPAGQGFVRVALPRALRERGGVLGHASVHAVTSNPTRTSPVKRGKWILENLLGQAPPPPPPGNDSLAGEAAIDSSRTFREQLAQHRERAACAVCHVRMDALGFALEHYDAIGRHRERDAGGEIDCSGELPDGTRLAGLTDLKRVVAADPAFVQTLTHKLFVHAVGRDLRPVDRLRLDHAIGELLAGARVTLRDLILVVARDPAFLRAAGTAR